MVAVGPYARGMLGVLGLVTLVMAGVAVVGRRWTIWPLIVGAVVVGATLLGVAVKGGRSAVGRGGDGEPR